MVLRVVVSASVRLVYIRAYVKSETEKKDKRTREIEKGERIEKSEEREREREEGEGDEKDRTKTVSKIKER